MTDCIVIIPARMAAVRLPNKPLADIAGVPMINWVRRRAEAANIGTVVVAAGDAEIVAAVEADGGRAVLTDPALPSGSDRVFAALQQLDPTAQYSVVVNLQGDLPNIDPNTIRAVLQPLADPSIDVGTVVCPIDAQTQASKLTDPDVVKAVLAPLNAHNTQRALYFSRQQVPYGATTYYEHIGLYAYRRAALARFVALPPSALETSERLEQLRAMGDGVVYGAAVVNSAPISVDNARDLEAARAALSA